MTRGKRKNTKADDYRLYLGDFVEVYCKHTQIVRVDQNGTPVLSNGLKGYVVDVSDFTVFLGTDPEVVFANIDIEDIGAMLVSEDISDELKFPTPPTGESH